MRVCGKYARCVVLVFVLHAYFSPMGRIRRRRDADGGAMDAFNKKD